MTRLARIEATLAENESVDRDFPPPKIPYVRVRRDDLRALVRLAKAMLNASNSLRSVIEENDALAALEEPCEQ
jgi:hypothetical protein